MKKHIYENNKKTIKLCIFKERNRQLGQLNPTNINYINLGLKEQMGGWGWNCSKIHSPFTGEKQKN